MSVSSLVFLGVMVSMSTHLNILCSMLVKTAPSGAALMYVCLIRSFFPGCLSYYYPLAIIRAVLPIKPKERTIIAAVILVVSFISMSRRVNTLCNLPCSHTLFGTAFASGDDFGLRPLRRVAPDLHCSLHLPHPAVGLPQLKLQLRCTPHSLG